jgi:hypothetical protein
MKRFVIGFAVGLGLMYWYLESADRLWSEGESWMQKSASGYRHDGVHDAARGVLGESKK